MRDYLISIRFFAEDDRDAWRKRRDIREVLVHLFEKKRQVEISNTEQAFLTRYHPSQRPKNIVGRRLPEIRN